MTGVFRPWIPLRESIGEEALRQSIEGFRPEEVLPDEDFGFVDCVAPHVADIYRRLEVDEGAGRVLAQLRRRGVTEQEIEIILRLTALLPSKWRSEDNEPWPQTLNRRRRLAARLITCAESVADDPELGGFCLGVGSMAFCKTPLEPGDLEGLNQADGEPMALSDLLRLAASFLDVADGKGSVALASDRASRPARAIALQGFVLRGVFDILAPHFSGRRAPNQQVEILASVVLQTEIPLGAVTRLRREERRRYYRDEQ